MDVCKGQLMRDIEATRTLFEDDSLEGLWRYLVDTPPAPHRKFRGELFEFVVRMFGRSRLRAPDARLGLVYLDLIDEGDAARWAYMLHNCLDGIGGIVMLHRRQRMNFVMGSDPRFWGLGLSPGRIEGYAREVFSQMPKELFEAGLPIIFDQSGVLCEFSPASEQLYVPNISFPRPERRSDEFYFFRQGRDISGFAEPWSCPIVPVEEMVYKARAREVAVEACKHRLDDLSFELARGFREAVGMWLYDTRKSDAENLLRIVDALMRAMPGCFDEEAIEMLAWYGRIEERWKEQQNICIMPHIFSIRKDFVPEYGDALSTLGRFDAALRFCLRAVSGPDETDLGWLAPGSDFRNWKDFQKFFKKSGIAYQLDALNAGVPLEHILA